MSRKHEARLHLSQTHLQEALDMSGHLHDIVLKQEQECRSMLVDVLHELAVVKAAVVALHGASPEDVRLSIQEHLGPKLAAIEAHLAERSRDFLDVE